MAFINHKIVILSIIAMYGLSVSTPAAANEYNTNPSIVVSRSEYPFLWPIGELESEESLTLEGKKVHRFGTGFLVSPCYILTNAHVVFGKYLVKNSDTITQAERNEISGKFVMTFRIGISNTSAFLGSTVARAAEWGARTAGGANDWTLLRLTTCIGKRTEFGWFEASRYLTGQMIGKRAFVAGFPGIRERGGMDVGPGIVKSVKDASGNLTFSGSMRAGQSGGPIIILENGQLKVIGLNTLSIVPAGDSNTELYKGFDNSTSNEFLNASAILNQRKIKNILDNDKAIFGKINPNEERASMLKLPFSSN